MERRKSFSFVALYLSGVSRSTLEYNSNYTNEFADSEQLDLIDSVPNALKVHALSRLRRDIFNRFKVYRQTKTSTSALTVLGEHTETFKNLDLFDPYATLTRNYDVSELFNACTVEINKLLTGVLTEFDFPYIPAVESLFYFPAKITTKELGDNIIKSTKLDNKFSFNIPIFRPKKMERYLSHIYYYDNSFFIAALVSLGEPYSIPDIEKRVFDWGMLKQKRDIRLEQEKQAELELEQVRLDKEKELQLEQEKLKLEQEKLEQEKLEQEEKLAEQEKLRLAEEESKKEKALTVVPKNAPILLTGHDSTIDTVFYVDCDNVTIFNFLSMLDDTNNLEGSATTVIKLYRDGLTNPIWDIVENIVHKNYTVIKCPVTRLKEAKSVVDIVLAADLSRDYHTGYGKKHVIVSSDSDFFGVILSGVSAEVMYEAEFTASAYLAYLSRENVSAKDISANVSLSRNADYKQRILKYLGLIALSNIPLTQLSIDKLKLAILTKYKVIDKDYDETVTTAFIELVAQGILNDFSMVSDAKGHHIYSGDISYSLSKAQ